MSRAWGDSDFLAALTTPIEVRPSDIERAELLLSDYLHCVLAGGTNKTVVSEPLTLAAQLAKAASHGDLDDVNWQLLIHPGSIVNSVIFALFITCNIEVKRIVPAMIAGYSAANYAAGIFSAGHSKKWHTTATSGIFGATCASAYLLGLDARTKKSALRLASVSVGGGANAAIARNGATRFTRIHATVMGILSTLEALNETPAPEQIINGMGGLATRFDLVEAAPPKVIGALSETSLRFFPWSGFSQNALVSLQGALPIHPKRIRSVRIQTPTQLFPLVGSEAKGAWWSIAAAVRSTLLTGDPMVKSEAPASFSVVALDSGTSTGVIEVATESGNIAIPFTPPTDFGTDAALLTKKWRTLAGAKSPELSKLAQRLVSQSPDTQVCGDVIELLQLNR